MRIDESLGARTTEKLARGKGLNGFIKGNIFCNVAPTGFFHEGMRLSKKYVNLC